MKFKDGKTFSAYVRSQLHSGYITSKLTAHDAVFVWCEQCELSFQMLKDTLVSAPILKYSNTLNHILYLQMLVSMDGQEC